MPYGTASPETIIILRENGLEDAIQIEYVESKDDYGSFEPSEPTYSVDVIVFGALDESFDIKQGYETLVVDAIATRLEGISDLEGEWEVHAYHPFIENIYSRLGSVYR